MSPRLVSEIVVVFRTFPIRVAGPQAGPLKDEITWEQLQRESGYPRLIKERTSVTHNVRRVARFDWEIAKKAVEINRPTKIAINGLDYLNASNRGVRDWEGLDTAATAFVTRFEELTRAHVTFCGTGPSLAEMFARIRCEQHSEPCLTSSR